MHEYRWEFLQSELAVSLICFDNNTCYILKGSVLVFIQCVSKITVTMFEVRKVAEFVCYMKIHLFYKGVVPRFRFN